MHSPSWIRINNFYSLNKVKVGNEATRKLSKANSFKIYLGYISINALLVKFFAHLFTINISGTQISPKALSSLLNHPHSKSLFRHLPLWQGTKTTYGSQRK